MDATQEPRRRRPVTARAARLALHVLIRWYTRRHDWFMVERLMNDLTRAYAEEENDARSE